MNPIHGADLAKACVAAVDAKQSEINVGGPQTMTYREVAELAFRTLGRPARMSSMPVWLVKAGTVMLKLFNRHQGELVAFFTTMMTNDMVAPAAGTHFLGDYFHKLAGQ
jgi:uncharacterized protein YbjT (DUF2867 family)